SLCTGIHSLSSASRAIQPVRMARVRTDVNDTSKVKPPSSSRRPAVRASSSPRSLRSTSVHPVNRFSRFHVDSPWRSNTSVYMVFSGRTGEGFGTVKAPGPPVTLYRRGLRSGGGGRLPDGRASRVAGRRAKCFLDAQQLVVLRHPVA